MRLALILIVLMPLADRPLLRAADEVLVSDDFPDLDPGWGQLTDSRQIKNNKLILTPPANRFHHAVYQGDLFGDVDIRVKVSQAKGTAGMSGGVLFWGNGAENNYLAEVRADGIFQIARIANGQALYPSPPQKSDAIKAGLGQTNELRVVTQGNLATFYINGRKVAAIQGNPPEDDSEIGLYAESDDQACTFEFSEFRVLKAPPAATPVAGGSDGGTLLADDFAMLDPAWGIARDELHVENNKLILAPPHKTLPTALYQGNLFGDADIRVKVSQAQGDKDCGGGIIFWAVGSSNYYLASIQSDGTFSIDRLMNGQWLFPTKPSQKTEAVRTGLGQTNELRLVTQGNLATFSINGRQLLAIHGYPPGGGSLLGLYADEAPSADSPSTWQFSEFQVLKPPPTGPVGGAPSESGVLYSDDFATLDPAWISLGAHADFIQVDDHKLIFTPATGRTVTPLYQGTAFGDVDIRVTVVESQGKTDRRAGIIFWGSNIPAESYLATIQTDGTFGVMRYSGGKLLTPVAWQASDAVNQGVGQANQLRVVTRGKSATFYINDRQVVTFKGFPPSGGGLVGLMAGSGDEAYSWQFSSFSVRTVQAEPAGEKSSATEPSAATKPVATAPPTATPTTTAPAIAPSASPAKAPTTPESVAAAWLTGDADLLGRKFERRDWKVELVGQRTVSLTDSTGENWAATWPLAACEPGEYLAVAHADDNEDLALQLYSGSPGEIFRLIAPTDNWAQSEVSLTANSDDIKMTVVGPHQGAQVKLHLYKAVKPIGITR